MFAEQVNKWSLSYYWLPCLKQHRVLCSLVNEVICLRTFLKKNKSSIKLSYLTQWMYIPCSWAGHKHRYSDSKSIFFPQITGKIPSEKTKRHYLHIETWPNFTWLMGRNSWKVGPLPPMFPNLSLYDRKKIAITIPDYFKQVCFC